MDALLEWSYSLSKLALFAVASYWFSFTLCDRIKSQKHQQLYPFISILFLPLFLSFKALQILGKGSLTNIIYPLVLGIVLIVLSISGSKIDRLTNHIKRLLREHWLWVAILVFVFAIFCWQGTYLEYPADPIFYLSTIENVNIDYPFRLSNSQIFGLNHTNWRFLFSLQDWILGDGQFLRYKLDLFTAFSKCLVLIAIYRVSFQLSGKKSLAIASSILFLGYYGNQEISALLYKDIDASTLVAIAYPELLLLLGFFYSLTLKDLLSRSNLNAIVQFVFLTWILLDSHGQIAINGLTIVMGIGFLRLVRLRSLNFSVRNPKVGNLVTLLAVVCLIFIGLVAISNRAMVEIPADYMVEKYASFQNKDLWFYWPNEPNSSVMLLDGIAVAFAIVVLCNFGVNSLNFFWASINVAPYLLFFNPLAVVGLSKLFTIHALHRVMYASQPWIYLPFACQTLNQAFKLRLVPIIWTLCGLAFVPLKPIYGKLYHVFLNPMPSYANGMDLQPIVNYLFDRDLKQSKQDRKSREIFILGDPYVNSYLAPWKPFKVYSSRELDINLLAPISYIFNAERTPEETANFLQENPVNYIVLNQREFSYSSWLGEHIRHWPPNLLPTIPERFDDSALEAYIQANPNQFELVLEANGFQLYRAYESNMDE